jgi:large subunit ribosomal protein L29
MKASELRDLSMEELGTKANELRNDLFNAKVKRSTGQLENSSLPRRLRRDIARVETILREKRGAGE